MNYDTNNLTIKASNFTPRRERIFHNQNKQKVINFDKSKDAILGDLKEEDLKGCTWKNIDVLGAQLKVDQVDKSR